MPDRATEVALFRYAMIREAADPALPKAERGRLVRELASRSHAGPGGVEVRVGRSTLDTWIRAWRAGGFEALKPAPQATSLKVGAETLELACALRREAPERTAAHIAQILAVSLWWAPSERTLQRHFRRLGRAPTGGDRRVVGGGRVRRRRRRVRHAAGGGTQPPRMGRGP